MYATIHTTAPAHRSATRWQARWSFGTGTALCHVDLGDYGSLLLDVEALQLLVAVLDAALELEEEDEPIPRGDVAGDV